MKNKTLLSALIILTVLFSGIRLYSFDGEQIGKIGDVNRKTGEIIVEAPSAADKIQMGTKLYVRIDEKVIIMEATYPMQTVVKCRLLKKGSGYLSQVKKWQPVYLYKEGVEKKDEEAARSYKKANRISGKHKAYDFRSFIGLSKGDTIDKAYEVLGKPTKVNDYTSDGYDWDAANWEIDSISNIKIYYNRASRKIENIYLNSSYNETTPGNAVREFISSHGVNDKKVSILGAQGADIEAVFGVTKGVNTDSGLPTKCTYSWGSTGRDDVTFTIGEDSGLCTKINVNWDKDTQWSDIDKPEKKADKNKSAKKVKANRISGKHKTADFISFIGLSKGDTINKAYEVLGKPTKVNDYTSDGYDWDAANWKIDSLSYIRINYKRASGKIKNINLVCLLFPDKEAPGNAAREYITSRVINDKKISMFGARGTDIAKMLGRAAKVETSDGTITKYSYEWGKDSVEFEMDEETGLCKNIWVRWDID